MRIERLAITNFDGFDHRVFTFHPQFTLLVGDNASGKTSLLNALSIAVGSWFLGIRGYQKSLGIEADEVRVVPYRYQDSFTFEKQFPVRIECSGLVREALITWTRELRGEGGRTTSVEAASLAKAAEGAERSVRAGEAVVLPLICTYGTERLWFEKGHRPKTLGGDGQRRMPSRLDGYHDCINFTIQETALIEWIRDHSTVTPQFGKDPAALIVVKNAMAQCIEGASSVYYDGRYRDLVVEMPEPRGPQLFRNLSDGQRIMLTLVGDLARRAATLNPQLEGSVLSHTNGVVLIDELDLHLHPRWQRRVIRDLRTTFPAIQFIATTHSAQLIGEVRPEEIRVLDSDETSTPPHSYGLDSSRIVEEVMHAPSRNEVVRGILKDLSAAADREDFADWDRLVALLEESLGPDDPEVTRARALMSFLGSGK